MSRALAVLACSAALYGCNGSPEIEPTVARPWPTTMDIPRWDSKRPLSSQLNPTQLAQLRRQGWGGDADSAYLMMQYSEDLSPAGSKDVDTWVRIAAENGSGPAASLLASRLVNLGGEQNCLRGKFWFEKAAALLHENSTAVATIKLNLADLAGNWVGCVARGDAGGSAASGVEEKTPPSRR